MKQICNPYLPLCEYIPDGEPHVFGGRLYLYGSHDRENGDEFCELDYVCYSADACDLTEWRYEGVIYRKDQDPDNPDGSLCLYAPDVCMGPDGRYYLYYCLKFCDFISVAVCDTPAGRYEYYGKAAYPDGRLLSENLPYDPAVLVEDGKVYLYYGFAPTTLQIPRYRGAEMPGGSVVELEADMRTVKRGPYVVLPSSEYGTGTSFEGHEYFEAPSIRKIGELYYLVYSSVHAHELCYAVSRDPMGGFVFGGVIVSNGDIGYEGRKTEDRLMAIGNNHGGLVCVKDQWYIFYHRHTHTNAYNRQGCAEPVFLDKNRLFGPFLSFRKERRYAKLQVDSLAIKCVNMLQPVKALSGGNKQKVVFGKWIADDADILILDCPTRGVDIGVKAAMYQLIYQMKQKGKSIIMISEEMPELIGMSDRLLVIRDGKVNGEFYRKDGYDQHKLIECMI